MKLTFLGTGDARQVPVWGCDCKACERANVMSTLQRKSACAMLHIDEFSILLDAGIEQLHHAYKPKDIDAILLTHFHVDHVQGLFPLRWGVGEPIPVHCPRDKHGCADLYKNHGLLDFKPLKKILTPLNLVDDAPYVSITGIPLNHSKETIGYCIEANGNKLAYLCDTIGLPAESEQFLIEWQPNVIVIDCTYAPDETSDHYNHNDLNDVLNIRQRLLDRNVAPAFWLTHISHEMDCYLMENWATLPTNVYVAKDQQTISIGAINDNPIEYNYLLG